MHGLFKIFSLLALVCAVAACSPYDAGVRRALAYAGENRGELERTIEHYSADPADSLKLKAALYLVRHMPYHISYPAGPYNAYCDALDSLFSTPTAGEELLDRANAVAARFEPSLKLEYDIRVITADYLIRNIDHAFRQWETSDYLRHLRFEEFCEYVLPYKCAEKQPLDTWKTDWVDYGRDELDHIAQIEEYRYNARRAAEAVNFQFKDSIRMQRQSRARLVEVLRLNTLARMPYGECLDRARFGVLNCRSKGIPVAFDFTPNWPDRAGSHHWNNILATKRRNIDYEPFRSYPGSFHYADNGLAKVFRETYAPHPLLLEAFEAEGSLPHSLGRMFMRDVTDEYGRTVDITVSLFRERPDTKYAYLAVFDNNRWVPVDIARIRRHKASFSRIGRGILYLVVTFRDGDITPVSEPFIVDTRGRTVRPRIDTARCQRIRLHRKFPAFTHIYNIRKFLHNGKLEASDRADFADAKTVAEFPEWNLLSGEEATTDTLPHRYWRLMASKSPYSDFAELYFYEKGTGKRIEGRLVFPDVKVRDPRYDTPAHISDGDPLSYMTVLGTTRWVGFDFGRPVAVDTIAYIRRGDGNAICPGDEYELYYWADNAWKLHQHKRAERVYLDFDRVPAGGLYYIKGLSRGEQNRVFVYENDEAVWY